MKFESSNWKIRVCSFGWWSKYLFRHVIVVEDGLFSSLKRDRDRRVHERPHQNAQELQPF
jgi:hypothetical protein